MYFCWGVQSFTPSVQLCSLGLLSWVEFSYWQKERRKNSHNLHKSKNIIVIIIMLFLNLYFEAGFGPRKNMWKMYILCYNMKTWIVNYTRLVKHHQANFSHKLSSFDILRNKAVNNCAYCSNRYSTISSFPLCAAIYRGVCCRPFVQSRKHKN